MAQEDLIWLGVSLAGLLLIFGAILVILKPFQSEKEKGGRAEQPDEVSRG
jgi:hypothetical protein